MNRIKFFRRQACITQSQLGEAVGVNRLKILRWERGQAKVPLEMKSKICAALGLDYKLVFPDQE